MPRREKEGFGARVNCPHCHGNGRPYDPQRREQGQRASNQAHGPAVALATFVTALAKSYVHRKEKAEEVEISEEQSDFILKKKETKIILRD